MSNEVTVKKCQVGRGIPVRKQHAHLSEIGNLQRAGNNSRDQNAA